ncbi:MAG TPA: NrfD/PsrC family molybdoenzyme membrane anchor subunit [Dissulfurispiraceae bacterium]|nr:NrfD/PsrC family molybdoenzyme membrane anchor subunit [Dissulfurispiraceae bacterium]
MLEKALNGGKLYWAWMGFLLAVFGVGFLFYLQQWDVGLGITGMSRDVSWGFYISQFTFLVGIAASGVMVVLPYYLHDYKAFGRITILGEFLAIPAVIMCVTFIVVDLGQPYRAMNVIFHPSPSSILFYDTIVLNGYLLLNLLIGWTCLHAEKKDIAPPKWVKPFIILSIIWAPSIHTVTAFIYAGIPGKHFWLTAVMAARFLASAFASGPALLLILALIVRKFSKFDPGSEAIQTLGKIVTYCMILNVFLLGLELFTAFYSGIPGHMHAWQYLYAGIDGKGVLVPLMWLSAILAAVSISMLVFPQVRKNETLLAIACLCVFFSLWIDKGFGLVVGGFVPNSFERVTEYWPTLAEFSIAMGVWALGFLILTVLYKVAVSIKEESGGEAIH